MSIKIKLLSIIIAITVSILVSISTMQWSVSTLISLSDGLNLSQLLKSDMLMLRRNEKDFLLRSDLKYLARFNKNYDILQANIEQLAILMEKNNIAVENYDSLRPIMEQYQVRFRRLVDISKKLSTTLKSLGEDEMLKELICHY